MSVTQLDLTTDPKPVWPDQIYFKMVQDVLKQGIEGGSRNEPTISLFGYMAKYKMSDPFPLLKSKYINYRSIAHELRFFLRGETNNHFMSDKGVHIWDKWALKGNHTRHVEYSFEHRLRSYMDVNNMQEHDARNNILRNYNRRVETDDKFDMTLEQYEDWFLENQGHTRYADTITMVDGSLGPIYGAMWRRWPELYSTRGYRAVEAIDQLKNAIELLKTHPNSRRNLVTAWNPSLLPDESLTHQENVVKGKQVLPPCHVMYQFRAYTVPGVTKPVLNLLFYQRSADIAVGVPYNIASYATLLCLVAHEVDMIPGELVHQIGDAHIYKDHVDTLVAQQDYYKQLAPDLDANLEHTRLHLNPQAQVLDFKIDPEEGGDDRRIYIVNHANTAPKFKYEVHS